MKEEVETDLVASPVVQIGSRMPRVHRRRPGNGLLAARRVFHDIVELAVARHRPNIQFVDRVPHTISLVLRAMRIACV